MGKYGVALGPLSGRMVALAPCHGRAQVLVRVCSTSAAVRHSSAPLFSRTSLLPQGHLVSHTVRRLAVHRPQANGKGGRVQLQCQAVKVTFTVTNEVNWGESYKVVGGISQFGNWQPEAAGNMAWSEGHVWSVAVDLDPGSEVEYKLVKSTKHDVQWEEGANRKFTVPSDVDAVKIDMAWGQPDGAVASAAASVVGAGAAKREGTASNGNGAAGASFDTGGPAELGEVLGSLEGDRLHTNAWQGADVRFMRSNEWSRERNGKWDAAGLQGAPRSLVLADEKAGSWLGKLDAVKRILVDEAPGARPDADTLAACYVYLQWIATGAIPCVEGGGHYRPNRHAELSQVIFRSLEWVMERPSEAAQVARKLHSKLPSFSDEFRASVPLTRIRDIAHRNDIPHDLKQEIKHTLQNKLHRNAGPEDLVATEAMLARLTAEAPHKGYPQAFLSEFAVFTSELRDFFNAGTLADMLNAVRPSLDDAGIQVLDSFLATKQRLASAGASADANLLIETLHSCTTVRALLASGLGSGMRNDAPDASLVMRQRWRLAESKCEEYAFTLLSRFINLLEEQGSAQYLSSAADGAWGLPIGACVLGVRHMGLGGWDPAECMAVERELAAWQEQGGLLKRDNALRLKASLERVLFLTQSWSDWQLMMFKETSDGLGRGLGLPAEQVSVFTEAEIRASVVFQLNKLSALLLKATRFVAGAEAWDCLVAGTSVGRLLQVDEIDPATVPGPEEGDLVLLVKRASGDEEVAAAGRHIRGIVLCQSLPHLSHLGVRARQERVPFVTCDDEELLSAAVRPLIGQQVCLQASSQAVTLTPASQSELSAGKASTTNGASAKNITTPAKGGAVKKVTKPVLLPLDAVSAANGGAKSACCAELERLERALRPNSTFKTPSGCVLPFGSMDVAIKAAGVTKQFSELLAEVQGADVSRLDELCAELQRLVAGLRPDKAVLKQIANAFDGAARVIVRSSSNVEDLAGMSGAGLYESIPNVPAADPAALGKAVAEVWASLYTRRAVLSRRVAGVDQADASMAVLAMEMLQPDLSFVLHTVSPLDHDKDVLYAELAVGQGETLASGTRGTAWRLSVDKASGRVTTHSFANFSRAYLPNKSGSESSSDKSGAAIASSTKPGTQMVDYSRQALSCDHSLREEVAQRLAAVGVVLEHGFKGPQDVEGCLVGNDLYIVQTRPQP